MTATPVNEKQFIFPLSAVRQMHVTRGTYNRDENGKERPHHRHHQPQRKPNEFPYDVNGHQRNENRIQIVDLDVQNEIGQYVSDARVLLAAVRIVSNLLFCLQFRNESMRVICSRKCFSVSNNHLPFSRVHLVRFTEYLFHHETED